MKNIYVGNLNFGASEESIRALFETHGTVGRVNIVTDRDNGSTPWLWVRGDGERWRSGESYCRRKRRGL